MILSPATEFGLIVFLRFPESGKVKTRLAETLGQERALIIYQELYDFTLELVKGIAAPIYLFYTGGVPDEKIKHSSFNYLTQPEGDLGERIAHALNHVLRQHPKGIIIGSDCPTLTESDIYQCAGLLDHHDVVIGPSTDGGYYMLGCKEVIPGIFKDIVWGASEVLSQTIAKLTQQGYSYSLLRTLNDIDTEEDWTGYQSGF